MQLSYTAREGGGVLKAAAEFDIETKLNKILTVIGTAPQTGLVRSFSLRREFPDVFHKLLAAPIGSPPVGPSATMTLLPEHFPYVIRDQRMVMKVAQTPAVSVRIIAKVGKTLPTSPPVPNVSAALTANQTLVSNGNPQDVGLTQVGLQTIPSVFDVVEDVVVIVPYVVSPAS